MSITEEEEIIDLTDSYCFMPQNISNCNGCSTNLVINLVNDIVEEETDNFTAAKIIIKRKRCPRAQENANKSNEDPPRKKSRNIGACSICWDELGKQQLASTKCGHVYCLQCLKTSLKSDKRCPTCRCILKGATAYHPLYLPFS